MCKSAPMSGQETLSTKGRQWGEGGLSNWSHGSDTARKRTMRGNVWRLGLEAFLSTHSISKENFTFY